MRHGVKPGRHFTADEQGVVFNKGPLAQLTQVHEGNVAESFGVALVGGLLEGLQVWLGFHHLHVMLTLRALVQDGQADGPLQRPGQVRVESSLHGVHEQGDVVGAAQGVGGLQVQAQAQLVARAARVEAGAVLHNRLARFLVPQVGGETFEAPDEDTAALLRLQLLHRVLEHHHPVPELSNLACL